MDEFESPQPPPNPSDEASIREIMDVEGISFAEARRTWEMMKSEVSQRILEEKEDNNG